ncbi:MAG: hypothetical protein MI702_04530 [Chlorobiales bacterium]|nr:hypothetical protein [Chlorobiales bacterium]
MERIFSEKSRCGLILDALYDSGKSFLKNVPKNEEERQDQEMRLQNDVNTIWYDPNSSALMKEFFVSPKWPERYRALGSGEKPSVILQEIRQEIQQKGLRTALINALGNRVDEMIKVRKGKGLPEYNRAFVDDQLKKLELAKEGLYELDNEAKIYRQYVGLLQAKEWLSDGKMLKESVGDNEKSSKPTSFIQFVVEYISGMKPKERTQFLETKSGDSSFFGIRNRIVEDYEQKTKRKAPKTAYSIISKAKKKYREERY